MIKANSTLDWQHDLDPHVIPLHHQFPVNHDLIGSDTVPDRVCRIRGRSNLDLAPLSVCRHELTFGCTFFELFVDALLLDATFSLDER